jgi:signal transduction histidine kinase
VAVSEKVALLPATFVRLTGWLVMPGRRPPSSDERGVLLEFPVFGSRESRGEHWLILELDLDYARDRWLPELIATHLNPGERKLNEARVKLGTSSSSVLCKTTTAEPQADEPVVSARFNLLGRTGNSRVPSRGGGRWLLEAWQHRGALEAAVAASQRRNFAVAAGVNLLMLATGLALIHFTRRSRRLAEAQMSFVATVSHELRTPLTVIRGAGHNLLRGVVKERAQVEEYSKLIIQHAERLTEMVEQTLALAGAGRGRAALSRERVELPVVLNEAVAALAEDTQAGGAGEAASRERRPGNRGSPRWQRVRGKRRGPWCDVRGEIAGCEGPPIGMKPLERILVAQISNLPYRRFATCGRCEVSNAHGLAAPSRLQVGDTADWKSALRPDPSLPYFEAGLKINCANW